MRTGPNIQFGATPGQGCGESHRENSLLPTQVVSPRVVRPKPAPGRVGPESPKPTAQAPRQKPRAPAPHAGRIPATPASMNSSASTFPSEVGVATVSTTKHLIVHSSRVSSQVT